MSIKESALTAITAISNSDFVRAVTSAGASRKITVANLAKQIVEGYTGSSLAGSNQSVKSAVDSLNSKFVNSSSSQTIVEYILSLPVGAPCIVRFSGEASTTIMGSTSQHIGIAFKADTTVVDMFVGAYAASKVSVVRITKHAVGDYTSVIKSATLS